MASNPNQAANQNLPSAVILNLSGNPMQPAATAANINSNPYTPAPSGGGGGSDPVVDIGKLQTHIRWIERALVGGGICLAALAGFGWHSYDSLTGQVTNLAVNQMATSGKIDILDSKINGKLDVIGQRLNDIQTPQLQPSVAIKRNP